MQEVRNTKGKLVCHVDPKTLTVEIVARGQKTIITFDPGKEAKVVNTRIT